jgi:undecaprenyl-diphosphatase
MPDWGWGYLQAIILGVIQGIAEFLPISSSGHLVIINDLMHRISGRQLDTDGHLLNVSLHVGTLCSILWVYFSDLKLLLHKPRVCLAILVATLPLVLIALTPLKDSIEDFFKTPMIAGCGLLVTAALLVLGQKMERNKYSLDEMPKWSGCLIGLFQAVALVPGISRSGSTIAGGLLMGLRRDDAANFSFFIAIPAIFGAAVLTGKDIWEGNVGGNAAPELIVGMLTAFFVGLISLRWLLRLMSQRKLHWFACYCTLAGLATILWQSLLV